MESPETLQWLVQSGAIGISFYLIYTNRKITNGQQNRMIDVVAKNNEVMGKLSEKLDELIRR